MCSFHKAFFKATLEEGHLCRLDSTLLASFPCIYTNFKNEFETFLGVSLFLDTHFEYFAFCKLSIVYIFHVLFLKSFFCKMCVYRHS